MSRIVVIGAVHSTEATLHKLVEHEMEVVLVLGQQPSDPSKVSALADMEPFCQTNKIPFRGFRKINDRENVEAIREARPDIIFAVGFSQLIGTEILSIPPRGIIGFHPTLLPRGRGRAPIAWLILRQERGAANFFLMGEGPDEGPIFVQKPFDVTEEDYASDVEQKIITAIGEALDEWLPGLKAGEWNPQPQDHSKATWYGKRTPADGHIDWQQSSEKIHRLVRASAPPHPGAYTYYGQYKMIITKAAIDQNPRHFGVSGRVLIKEDKRLLVGCGEGNLWLNDYWFCDADGREIPDVRIGVGKRLGYNIEDKLFKLLNDNPNG